jgi:hypothetical protein
MCSFRSATSPVVVEIVLQRGESACELLTEPCELAANCLDRLMIKIKTSRRKLTIKAKAEQGFIFDARDYSLFETTRFEVVPRLNF